MSRLRLGAWVTFVLLLLGFSALIIFTTPWHPLPGKVPGGPVHPDAGLDFSAAQIARETAYHDTIRPIGLTWLVVSLVVPAVLGFSPIGARLVDRLRARHWLVQTTAAVVGMTLAVTVVTLAFAAREHAIERHYGLTLQGWGGWTTDLLRAYAVGTVTTLLVIVVIVALARRLPRSWWIPAAALGAALVIGGSFVYPYVVEPVFNKFHSLPAGPLRTELLDLARQDHQPLSDILVSDASRRTTTENAYVSGFGASRRLVLYDTLINQDTPSEIRVLTAHELGHAKYDDVLHGTIEGGQPAHDPTHPGVVRGRRVRGDTADQSRVAPHRGSRGCAFSAGNARPRNVHRRAEEAGNRRVGRPQALVAALRAVLQPSRAGGTACDGPQLRAPTPVALISARRSVHGEDHAEKQCNQG